MSVEPYQTPKRSQLGIREPSFTVTPSPKRPPFEASLLSPIQPLKSPVVKTPLTPSRTKQIPQPPQLSRPMPTYSPVKQSSSNLLFAMKEAKSFGVQDSRAQWAYACAVTNRWTPSPLHEHYSSTTEYSRPAVRCTALVPTPLYGVRIGLTQAVNDTTVFGGVAPSTPHPRVTIPKLVTSRDGAVPRPFPSSVLFTK